MSSRWAALLVCAVACTGVQPRYPDDVQAALAHTSMRRLETERFIIYYPEGKRPEIDRFLVRADRCAAELRHHARIHDGEWSEKMVLVMPDVAFNNAFVEPELAGYEAVSVIPLQATLDFTTELGIPPDSGYIACHELTHYVQGQQIAGTWSVLDDIFGHLYNPQLGYDPWFVEGLATHYESRLSRGVGRPHWPLFAGVFAAAYAHEHVTGGDLSAFDRRSPVGNHYLVGTMFVRFLTERYGERALWTAIADEAHAVTGWFFTGTFEKGFGRPLHQLLDEFDTWVHATFPARVPPPAQHRLATLGNNARYARGRDGTEAWVTDDVDLPARFVVRDRDGHELVDQSLVEIVPPRKLVQAAPWLVSGLSITADGGEVWLTVIDLGATFQISRTLRWQRATGKLEQIADDLGPGATISPDGQTYYYCWVHGDEWSLAAYSVAAHTRQFVVDMKPGTYVLGAQASPDGRSLVASVWDGYAFVAWELDAVTGRRIRTIGGDAAFPIYDPSYTSDGRVLWLGTVADRFQVFVEGAQVTDAPYAVLAAREAAGTIRFLDREGWSWDLAETPLPAGERAELTGPRHLGHDVNHHPPHVQSDEPFSIFDHLFFPQQRSWTLLFPSADAAMMGAVLAGGDRLGLQRWSLAGYLQPGDHERWGGDFAYLNTMLSPVMLFGEGSVLDWRDHQQDTYVERRTRDVTVAAIHTYRGSLTTIVGGVYTDDYDPTRPIPRVHLGGPAAGIGWTSSETTRDTGDRRAITAGIASTYYPHAASTFAGNITDVSAGIGGVVPLPFGRRHTLHALVRGRALIAPFDTGLLQLGGDDGLAELWNHSSSSAMPPMFDTTRFPPHLRFVEPLRGYEDYEITTDRAALADLSWKYPIIIDRGFVATARILPASYLRQLDLELFGAGALDRAGHRHVAGGAAVTVRFQLLRISFAVTYQIARRLVDDRALTQLVALGPDF